MAASAPFTGFYSKAMRDQLRCMSGDEAKMFVTVALYSGPDGKAGPGVRELHDATGYHTEECSALLKVLQAKGLVIILRQNERDALSGQMLPNVYIVNPDIVLVKDRTLWQENRVRHASMPESGFPVKTVQAEQNRIRKQNQEVETAKQTASEGGALLQKANANTTDLATRTRGEASTASPNGGTQSTTSRQRQPNSSRSAELPPSSGAPPSANLSFVDSLAVEAIRRQVPDMSHEKAVELVQKFGVNQFTAAVMAMKERAKRVTVKRPTGWIQRSLEKGAGK